MFITDTADRTGLLRLRQPWGEVLTSPVLEDKCVNEQKAGRDEHLLICC